MNTPTHKSRIARLFAAFREPVNGLTHLFGALLALVGTIWLVTLVHQDIPKVIVFIVYGLSMITLYMASGIMHLYNGRKEILYRLNQFDHAAIYLLIAGTYTPFAYGMLEGGWRWSLLGIVWGLAIIGAVLKLGFNMYGHISTLFYVAMGWVVVFFLPAIIRAGVPANVLWLIAGGGISYTFGAVIFAIRKPNFHIHFGHHEIWHLFVMAGSALHFIAVRMYVV